MNQAEMLAALLENPKRKAKEKNDSSGSYLAFEGIQLLWSRNYDSEYKNPFIVCAGDHIDIEWEIIEPDLESVDFIEAIKAYIQGNDVIKSLVSDKIYHNCVFDDPCVRCKYETHCNEIDTCYCVEDMRLEEIEGKWHIIKLKENPK